MISPQSLLVRPLIVEIRTTDYYFVEGVTVTSGTSFGTVGRDGSLLTHREGKGDYVSTGLVTCDPCSGGVDTIVPSGVPLDL